MDYSRFHFASYAFLFSLLAIQWGVICVLRNQKEQLCESTRRMLSSLMDARKTINALEDRLEEVKRDAESQNNSF